MQGEREESSKHRVAGSLWEPVLDGAEVTITAKHTATVRLPKPVEELEAQAYEPPPRPRRHTPPSLPTQLITQHTGTTLTPDEALAAEELARTRLFLKVCAILASTLALACPQFSGGPLQRWGVTACCVVAATVALLYHRTLRDPRGYTKTRWLIVACVLMTVASLGILFVGVFSPAPMVGTFGIYFMCLGSSRRVAFAAYLSGALIHLVPSLVFAAGRLPDPGQFSSPTATGHDKLLIALMVQVVYGLTFVLARGSRRATRAAVEKLHRALAQVQKREALLAEAHLDLDRALRGGFGGRYSDRQLGPWQLGEVIGRGAMSEVYRARHAESGLASAVKVLHRDLAADPQQVKRFLREATIASELESPHVARVLSFGNFDSAALEADEPPYLAMELLEGHDLAWYLRRERRLSSHRVLELVEHVARALTCAHQALVVHRDLKPQNLFCVGPKGEGDRGPEGSGARRWMVLDFGVSKLTSSSGTLTRGQIVGTPGYMAPEQARGSDVDARADVFALAVITYRALTGRPAFTGKEMPSVLFDLCYTQPIRPSRLVAVPEDVERVLALGLAKRPEDRPTSARAFADALADAFSSSLEPRLRAQADALLVSAPWGARPPGA